MSVCMTSFSKRRLSRTLRNSAVSVSGDVGVRGTCEVINEVVRQRLKAGTQPGRTEMELGLDRFRPADMLCRPFRSNFALSSCCEIVESLLSLSAVATGMFEACQPEP